MLDLEAVAQQILQHAHAKEEAWTGYHGHSDGFHIVLPIGLVEVSTKEDGAFQWSWSVDAPRGHHIEAARGVIARKDAGGVVLLGSLDLVPAEDASPSSESDHSFAYRAVVDPQAHGLDETTLGAIIFTDVAHLLEAIALYAHFIQVRLDTEARAAAHAADWPTGLALLIEDDTEVGLLGIVFSRFEDASIHDHAFFHPNADAALRRRIVASWNKGRPEYDPQPFGDPDAPSASFAEQRAESVAFLTSG